MIIIKKRNYDFSLRDRSAVNEAVGSRKLDASITIEMIM